MRVEELSPRQGNVLTLSEGHASSSTRFGHCSRLATPIPSWSVSVPNKDRAERCCVTTPELEIAIAVRAQDEHLLGHCFGLRRSDLLPGAACTRHSASPEILRLSSFATNADQHDQEAHNVRIGPRNVRYSSEPVTASFHDSTRPAAMKPSTGRRRA